MEIEIKNNKFWLLEQNGKENKKWIYGDEKLATSKLKELIKTTNTENLVLLSIDTGKEWKITPVPWHIIALNLVKE